MRQKKWWIIIPLVLILLYLFGPHPSNPNLSAELPTVPTNLVNLETFIRQKEAAHKLRPDNEARIIWANDSTRGKTPFSILYLHGFTASQEEGDPVHYTIAKKFGCNLYLSRLADHGLDTVEQMLNFSNQRLWESAKEAYAIASRLGEKVIIMGTSTGGTLSLLLSAQNPGIYAQILLSPNIEIFDHNAWILNNPWGLQAARLITGSKYVYSDDTRPIYKQYWSYGYRLEAVAELQELLEGEIDEDLFRQIKAPTLMLYYYKDDVHQDSVVKVNAMLRMFNSLGTPSQVKRAVALPEAGNHVLGSYIKSNDVSGVIREIESFMEEVLMMKKH